MATLGAVSGETGAVFHDYSQNFDGSKLSGPSVPVQAIPSLTIFKLVHVYFMSSRTPHCFCFDQSCKAHVTPVTYQQPFAR